jgi:hypothetical protein
VENIWKTIVFQGPWSLTCAFPTPPNSLVNQSKLWNSLIYLPRLLFPHPSPPLPEYYTNLPPKFPDQYSYHTDGSFKPPKENQMVLGNKKKPDMENTALVNTSLLQQDY